MVCAKANDLSSRLFSWSLLLTKNNSPPHLCPLFFPSILHIEIKLFWHNIYQLKSNICLLRTYIWPFKLDYGELSSASANLTGLYITTHVTQIFALVVITYIMVIDLKILQVTKWKWLRINLYDKTDWLMLSDTWWLNWLTEMIEYRWQ